MNLLAIKLGAGLIILVGLIAGYISWEHHLINKGIKQESDRRDALDLKASLRAQDILTSKNEEVRKLQEDIQTTHDQIIAKSQELQSAKDDYNKLRTQYVTGAKRMSIAVASCQGRSPEQSESATTSSGISENRADLLPETAATIFDIGRGIKEDVRLKNECIDLYNDLASKINKE
jgi:hypothetical protein